MDHVKEALKAMEQVYNQEALETDKDSSSSESEGEWIEYSKSKSIERMGL
jgi:hypothetical protein